MYDSDSAKLHHRPLTLQDILDLWDSLNQTLLPSVEVERISSLQLIGRDAHYVIECQPTHVVADFRDSFLALKASDIGFPGLRDSDTPLHDLIDRDTPDTANPDQEQSDIQVIEWRPIAGVMTAGELTTLPVALKTWYELLYSYQSSVQRLLERYEADYPWLRSAADECLKRASLWRTAATLPIKRVRNN